MSATAALERDVRRLLIDLVDAYITNLEGHRAAIAEIPELALVADEGYEQIDEQLERAHRALGFLLDLDLEGGPL